MGALPPNPQDLTHLCHPRSNRTPEQDKLTPAWSGPTASARVASQRCPILCCGQDQCAKVKSNCQVVAKITPASAIMFGNISI